MIALLTLLACGEPEPVLQAIQPTRSPEEIAERRSASELRASPRNLEATYKKAEGVYVDARFFGGRSYRLVRAEIEQQFGALVEEREGAGGARELVFERGTLRLSGENIQMVEVPFAEPVRRSEALALLGFPPAVGEYQAALLEYRLLNAWGFRRIRFFRKERGSEDISRVQVWKFSDGDG